MDSENRTDTISRHRLESLSEVFGQAQVDQCVAKYCGGRFPARLAVPEGIDALFMFTFASRTGSTHLASLLETNSSLPLFAESLNLPSYERTAAQVPSGDPRRSLAILLEKHSRGGVSVLKGGMQPLLLLCLTGVFDALLEHSRFVQIERKDILGQALSNFRVAITDVWHITDEEAQAGNRIEDPEACFDYDRILRHARNIVDINARLRRFYEMTGATFTRVFFEDVMSEPRGALTHVLEFLGQPVPDTLNLQSPFRATSDEANELWRSSFLERLSDDSETEAWFLDRDVCLRNEDVRERATR